MNEIIKKNGISFGVGMGILSVLITTVIYAVDMELFTAWWLGLMILALFLIIDCVLLSRTKKELNGQMTFKEGFTVFFIASLISNLISTLYNVVLFNFVDPSAKETIKELSIKAAVRMMENFNAPASQINASVDQMQQQDNYSIESLATGFVITLCVSCVLGLILALIFKSRPAHHE